MTRRGGHAPRVGLFGLLGSGNIGNDISMRVVLGYLREHHPEAVIDAMCMGPEQVRAHEGIDATLLEWSRAYEAHLPGWAAKVLKAAGKGVDAFRTAAWVRRHDVVIVPGTGVLEASTPINPWGVPYALLLLCGWGRVLGTKVALVSVGATVIRQPSVRLVSTWAARLAYYRSYRDVRSLDAMRQRGLDVSRDRVFPDLVLTLSPARAGPPDPETVGVGVMTYFGTNDERTRADQVHASYTAVMTDFVRWLIDHGRNVHLYIGDMGDDAAVADIVAAVRVTHPGLADGRLVATRLTSFAELMTAMTPASSVIATRYHNVVCALKLGKPTISLGYSDKNVSIMEDMGLPEFTQHASAISFDRLIGQFSELEQNADQIRSTLHKNNEELSLLAAEQFTLLDAILFGRRRGPATA